MTAASAAVVFLGAALTACGSGGGEGYAAVGPVGGSPSAAAAGPTDAVTLVPLDGPTRSGGETADRESHAPRAGGAATAGRPERTASGRSSGPASSAVAEPPEPGRTTPEPPSPTSESPSPTPAPLPAALTWGAPAREATEQRWCEDVTMSFHNSGGTAVRSGTLTFGTHVIDALGIDWATVESTEDLPAPIGAGARKDHTWTVCVDAWQVPLGMHVETRDVHVKWK
ncbi:hypothetical protein ABZ915_10875 [Streptomyces sp. NPDC046915]|uniref:hypothetical protein n=1 Tax=Streptomyces sp. NPDC046915 TaxID=3155257 RepID=UPI0033CFD791